MSSDNGIYVVEFPDGTYRVAEGSDSSMTEAFDLSRTQTERDFYLYWTLKNAEVYTNIQEATDAACRIEKDFGYTEYGVCILRAPTNFPAAESIASCKGCEGPVRAGDEDYCLRCKQEGANL